MNETYSDSPSAVPAVLSELSSIFSRDVSCPKLAGTFLHNFFQHWTSPAGDRERHQGYGEIPGLALLNLLFTGLEVDFIL
jgi:hypothetical protein